MGLTRSSATLKSQPLAADNLAKDFGIRSALAQECIAEFARAISQNKSVQSPWHVLFCRLWGSSEKKLIAPLGVLARKLGTDDLDQPLHVLFALQTYYALLLHLLIRRFENLRRYDLIDPLFAWCLESDCPKIQSSINRIAEALANYELDGAGSTSDATGDLLKSLHHSLFPRAIRHPLGEYYTPDWLAEHVLDQLGFDGTAPSRLLDPSCGSGTFLMAAIRRIRRAMRQTPPALPSPALTRKNPPKRRRHRPQSARGDVRPGELLDRAMRFDSGRRSRTRNTRSSRRLDPRHRKRAGQLRFRRRQSAVDRLGQPA
jgi:hypothetical protein